MRQEIYTELFTDEQIESHRNRWLDIGLAIGPTDWGKAKKGIELAYKAANLNPPSQLIKFDSPNQAIEWVVENKPENSVRNQISNQIKNQVADQVRDQVSNQVRNQVRNQVTNRIVIQIWSQIWSQFGGDQIWDPVADQVRGQVCFGSHGVALLARLLIFDKVPEVKKLEGLILLAKSTGWFFPYEDLIVMSERPSRIDFRDEKAIYTEYPDGWFIAPSLNEMEILAMQV